MSGTTSSRTKRLLAVAAGAAAVVAGAADPVDGAADAVRAIAAHVPPPITSTAAAIAANSTCLRANGERDDPGDRGADGAAGVVALSATVGAGSVTSSCGAAVAESCAAPPMGRCAASAAA